MCTLCQALDPSSSSWEPHSEDTLTSGSVSGTSAGKPYYTVDQVATYLTDGFWADSGRAGRSFDVQSGGTITYNFSGLDSLGKQAAAQAMEAWTAVSGLQFQAVSGTAMINFDDNNSGAYNSSSTSGSTIITSNINVDAGWRAYGDYYLQTYIHEIGHAIGLGHTGNYNGSATYSRDAGFANDSWQISVMSYFDQNQNTAITASRVFLATPQLADIVAVQNLYGTPTNVRTGDTTYGDGQSTGQLGMDLPGNKAVAIVDSGGTDHINLGSRNANQRLDLNAETYSDLNGYVGNFSIARGTVIENATTGGGNDILIGNAADNRLSSGAGDDTIFGNGGNDVLIGGAGADILTGGTGADRFTYLLLGDAGDTVTDFSLAQGDRMDITALLAAAGYSGSDPVADGVVSLQGGANGSWLMVDADGPGGSAPIGVALLIGVAATTPVGDIIDVGSAPVGPDPTGGNDTTYRYDESFRDGWTELRGRLDDHDGGTDTIDVSTIGSGMRIFLDASKVGRIVGKKFEIVDGTEIENLILGDAADYAFGNPADNLLDGRGGNDRIYGLEGDDEILGGTGSDRLYGGAGDDGIDGGDDSDRIYGDEGDDVLTGGLGNDRLYGGDGADRIDAGADSDAVWGGEGDDVITLGDGRNRAEGDGGNDRIDGGDDIDRIGGGAGDDEITGGGGNDMIDGDDGNDILFGGAGVDRLGGDDGDDMIQGGDDDDRLYGDNGNDILTGDAGDDRLYGGNDNDMVTGGDGLDRLYGDRGDDLLDGGEGNDMLYGGTENDVLFGGAGDDVLDGDTGDDEVHGGDGNDRIVGDRGIDTITGGAGEDRIDGGTDNDIIDGGADADSIIGGSGDDQIIGGAGDDRIDAGVGDDILTGGEGADRLTGGSGSDVFRFVSLADRGDVITDFSLRQDKIDLSGILSEIGTTLADAIANGNVVLAEVGRSTILQIDIDGEGGADAVDIVEIARLDHETALDTGWLV